LSDIKTSIGFLPSAEETLEGYSMRIREIAKQIEGYSQGHIKWFTHYGPGACWICDILNVLRYTTDIMNDVSNELASKKIVLKAEHPKGSTNPEYFEFLMHPHH